MYEVTAPGRLQDRAALAPTVIGITPLERPDAGLVVALASAGALGVLDLGRDRATGLAALRALARRLSGTRTFGVRVPEGVAITLADLPAEVGVVVVADPAIADQFPGRTVLAQVTSLPEARQAIAAGAAGLIAKGAEAGGRVGEETAFVLVQQLLAAVTVPVWAQGGIGVHTAAACIAGGAAGVVVDTQLALVRESSLASEIRAAIGAMDGSETTLLAGHRVYTRPDLPVAALATAIPAPSALAVRARLGGDELTQLLPLGQDAAFAKSLAQRFPTASRLVRGIVAAIDRHLLLAAEVQPLAAGSPLAAAHGLRYPIAQGPMSRVSDRARFALAVAEAGGLPFLALTLMSASEVRELLRETVALLGDRPWGAGILGFVPQEIRDAQLEVLREIPPPVALIAGGRPSQATALEKQGIPTYLHVPSPGLLDLFLRDGARRFIFEGRECGGHVGPRSSFALWEAQLERLLAHPAASELSILFAGGIHDARSAAMVAAMAAPLAARGAKIGVLMGTAYLFTEEAVSAGAIQPTFQEAAVACEHTVLLETAPGHATRCTDSAFAAAFTAEKHRLEAAGTPPQEIWAALEQLNLGRLRIAAKGLRRDGAAIVSVDADAQRAEGMFMIGQVAALRHATCTVAELHREVGDDGAALVAAAARAHAPVEASTLDADIAIIGVATIFAGAPDTETFWANIVAGKNAIREVSPSRWSVDTYYDPNATGTDAGKKTPCKWGGFLDEVPFDPLAYGIPPRSLTAIEPVQLLSLEIARRALVDAGYATREFDRERTSVVFGAEAGTDLSSAYGFRAMYPRYVGPLPGALDEALPTLNEDSFPGVLANVIAGRIANRLDLGGVNYTVDAACASSLAAVDVAVKELRLGTSEMVLCGGADLHNSINDYLLFASVHALSPTGQCHTFDANADGIVLGEGVACVVLKRLADALRDGDRVYALIKSVAGASDGKSLGLTAPRKEGQVRALDRAYGHAKVSPSTVELVEAHGTGTVVGDRTELATLTEVFASAGVAPGACVLGSVKSQIGHTKCAAGMAGIVKAALAIHHGVLPPTSNLRKPNSYWDASASPFAFLDEARPWRSATRTAGVSAFGFGGTNFHAILTSHTPATSPSSAWPSELFLFRAADRATALAAVDKLSRFLAERPATEPAPRLRDLARAVYAGGRGPVQLAIVADDLEQLVARLGSAKTGTADRRGVYLADAAVAPGAVAFLCPGQGSQRPGMLSDLFVAFPRLREILDLGARWADRMLPPAVFDKDARTAQAAALTDTRVAQPALGMADLAMAQVLRGFGVEPALAGGHSYGELAALAVGGAIGAADLLALSEARGQAILAAAGSDPGAMLAVASGAEAIADLALAAGVVIANHNSPTQSVLSGPTAAIEAAQAALAAKNIGARRIPVACAFHSPVVAGASATLAARLDGIALLAPRIPVWSNVTGAPHADAPAQIRAKLAEQVAAPVRFVQQIEAMYAAGARIFVEAGPGQVLTNLVGAILGDRPHQAIATDVAGEPGIRQLLRALGALAAAGVPVDGAALFSERDAALLEIDPDRVAASRAKAATGWLVDGHTARPVTAPPPAPATPVAIPAPVTAFSAPTALAAPAHNGVRTMGQVTVGSERDLAVLEYLRGTRELIAAQRDVMLSYLGAAPVITAWQPAQVAHVAHVAHVGHAAPVAQLAAAAPVAAAPAPTGPLDLMQVVLTIVSERTGYPPDTLGPDLDLEADLSIDSIKRIEIVGELAARVGLRLQDGAAGDTDAVVEELATRKTLRAMVAWLTDKLAGSAAAPAPDASSVPEAIEPAPSAPVSTTFVSPEVERYVLALAEAPLGARDHSHLGGRAVAIIDDGRGVAARLASLLADDGATVRLLGGDRAVVDDAHPAIDALIDLGALAGAPVDPTQALRAQFERIREAVLAGATTVLVATGHGGHLGLRATSTAPLLAGGASGLVKTLAAEWPTVRARVIDLDPAVDAAHLAAHVHDELGAAAGPVEVGYDLGARVALSVVSAPLAVVDGLALDRDAVVLVTGGARGITAHVAIALARRFGCRIELVGRSPLPPAEAPELAAATDAPALRKLFLAQRTAGDAATPAAIEAKVTRVLADREIRATLAAIRDAGGRPTYHAVDVRTPAFGALVDELYRTYDRLDGVIHGAGLLEDKLIRHKTSESFTRVVSTKLAGATALVDKLRADVKFVVLFASVAGAFGNRGQVDYAAANDALDKLARGLDQRIAGRVVSIDWGPWGGTGMVSPELEREYARRGIGLIEPVRGVEALVRELDGGGEAQVILMAGDPRAWAPLAAIAPAGMPAAHLARTDALAHADA